MHAKLGDVQSWILSKQANNRPNVKVLSEAIKNYQAAVDAGDASLVTRAKLEQSKLILLLNKDIRRDVLDEKGRRALAAERARAFQAAVLALNAIIAADAKSQKPKDRGDYGSKVVQAKIMASQWLGTVKVTMAGMLDMGLVTAEDLRSVGIAGTTAADINKDAVNDFDNAISLYASIKVGSAQKASLGLNIAFVYSGKANALATIAFNAKSEEEKNEIFKEVTNEEDTKHPGIIEKGIEGAQKEKDKIAEGMLLVLKGNILFWQAGNVDAAVASYGKGFSLITGMSIDALAGSDYVGIGLEDLAHYADAKALSTYKKGVSDDERKGALALLQKIIETDKDMSVYSATAHMRKGDLVIATTKDKGDKDAEQKLGEAVKDFAKALDIMRNAKLGEDMNKQILLFEGDKVLDKDLMGILCRLVEAEVRLYNTQIKGEANKAARWKKEYALVNRAREIVRKYLVQMGIWQASDKVRDMRSIIDGKLTNNPDTKDIGDVLRRVSVWRAALVKSGDELKIPEASKVYGEDWNAGDTPEITGE
jgi:hypothetical protein